MAVTEYGASTVVVGVIVGMLSVVGLTGVFALVDVAMCIADGLADTQFLDTVDDISVAVRSTSTFGSSNSRCSICAPQPEKPRLKISAMTIVKLLTVEPMCPFLLQLCTSITNIK